MGILQVLGFAPSPATAAAVDPAAALAAAKKKYDDEKQALEAGDLAQVPAKAPAGVESLHAAVLAARKALPAAPKTASDYAAASKAVAVLAKRATAYLAGAAAALAHLKSKVDAEMLALAADLAQLPAGAPAGLETAFTAVTAAQAALPADPQTNEEVVAALKALPALKKSLAAFLKAAAQKKRVDDGIGEFGSCGAKVAELKGADTLNDEQKRMLDESLRKRLSKPGAEVSEKDLKKFAQAVVEKTAKLAETPIEKKVPGLNAALAKSDTLKTNIVKLQAAKWKITVNAPGKGSYCDKTNKTIAIDPSAPLDVTLGNLAHETGHALYTAPANPTVKASASGTEYVRKCTESNFLDEGEAQFVACRAVKDLDISGVAAKVPADGGEFVAIYVRFTVGEITQDAARIEMAKHFSHLVTSTTGETYLVYYGSAHITNWNAANKKDATKQLTKAILTTMTLFP